MTTKARLYVTHRSGVKPLYWFEVGSDQSVYFGTAIRNLTRSSALLDVELPEGGFHPIPSVDHFEKSEARGKHSFHASGTVLGPRVGDSRHHREIGPLREHDAFIPLVGVFPPDPTLIAASERSPDESDVVVQSGEFDDHPFAFLAYVQPPAGVAPALPTSRWNVFFERLVSIRGISLHLAFYSDFERFPAWPDSQHELVAAPLQDDVLVIPIFADAPRARSLKTR
jgi:hypothetical protein